MKIYFSASITGGREHQEYYDVLILELKKHGEVISEFVADKNLTSLGSVGMTPQEIYDRDVSMIQECDIVVADITTPSTGVGYEIAYAEKLQKPVFCLYQRVENKKASSMIVGNPYCAIYTYMDIKELLSCIDSIFSSYVH